MSRNLQFVNNSNKVVPAKIDTGGGDKPKYEDNSYNDGYKELQLKFTQKVTWLRFLPPVSGSQGSWIYDFNLFKAPEGQVHPTFVDPESFGQPSVWVYARNWFMKNAKEQLMKRDVNPHGFKLRSSPRGIAWVLVTGAESGSTLRLLNTSMYDGKYGGTSGLGYEIFNNANVRDNEPGSATIGQLIHGDITDPNKGKLVCVEKSLPESGDTKYASYTTRIGKADAPIKPLLEALTDEEYDKIVPLEKVLRIPTEEEQKQYLLAYIGESWYSKIFPE
jgi:hypothetical protein